MLYNIPIKSQSFSVFISQACSHHFSTEVALFHLPPTPFQTSVFLVYFLETVTLSTMLLFLLTKTLGMNGDPPSERFPNDEPPTKSSLLGNSLFVVLWRKPLISQWLLFPFPSMEDFTQSPYWGPGRAPDRSPGKCGSPLRLQFQGVCHCWVTWHNLQQLNNITN